MSELAEKRALMKRRREEEKQVRREALAQEVFRLLTRTTGPHIDALDVTVAGAVAEALTAEADALAVRLRGE